MQSSRPATGFQDWKPVITESLADEPVEPGKQETAATQELSTAAALEMRTVAAQEQGAI